MPNASLPIDILILAFIAVVVAYRLYRKFGTHVDVEKPKDTAVPPPSAKQKRNREDDAHENSDFPPFTTPEVMSKTSGVHKTNKVKTPTQSMFNPNDEAALVTEAAKSTLDDVRAIDTDFAPTSFLCGTSIAYEMLTLAVAQGDTHTLRPLVSNDLFNNLCTEIKQRFEQKYQLDVELISINDMRIIDASLDGDVAMLQVAIESEQSYALYDENKELIQGDNEEVLLLRDIWHLQRDLKSSDPNWTLVAIVEDDSEDDDGDDGDGDKE